MCPTGLVDQHVGRLDVAVHDPGGVRGADRVEQVEAEAGDQVDPQRAVLLDQLQQGLRAHVLHDQPGPAVLLDDVVHGGDRRVVEPGRGAASRNVRSRRTSRSCADTWTPNVTSLTATSRSSTWSWASQTTPMPPRPISCCSR